MNYYPFHIGDYASHTAHLDATEDIAYRRLLDLYYVREGPLPCSIEDVARLVRMRDHVEAVCTVLNEFFTKTVDGWAHSRCDAEIAKMQDKQSKARTSAAASVASRRTHAERTLSERSTNAERTFNERSANVELPIPIPIPIPIPESKDYAANAAGGEPPTTDDPVIANGKDKTISLQQLVAQGVDRQHAADWLKVRRAKRAPLTATAWDDIRREADKAGITPAEAVRVSATNSWQGFKASWLQNGTRARAGPSSDIAEHNRRAFEGAKKLIFGNGA